MNLKETKKALENSVKEAIQSALNEKIEVNAVYNTDKGAMNVTIIEKNEAGEGKNANTLYYGITYTEEDHNIAIISFNRIFVADELSVVNVVVEPVVVDEKFMSSVKNIIMYGMDKVYHPENYEVKEEAKADEPANADAEAAPESNVAE